jgi:hypothetical protein
MKLPDTILIKNRRLDVHLGGPGFGEGVFITVGGVIGIGIDCCSSFFQSRGDRSFIQRAVSDLSKEPVIVWILTHYHYDHFHYLPSVLKLLGNKVSATVFPFDYNPADLSYLSEQIAEFPDEPPKIHRAQKEYGALRSLLKLPPFARTVLRVQGVHEWMGSDLILPTNEVIPLRVTICSCSSDVYDKQIGSAVMEVQKTASSTERVNANRGSYIIQVEVGNFEGLFLGDAGTERVEQLLESELVGKRGVDCLKVGHHGSLDATNNRLLELCAKPSDDCREQHALIAPYNSAGLPNMETIKLLKEFGYTVHISGKMKEKSDIASNLRNEGIFTTVNPTEASAAGSDMVSLAFQF